MKTRRTISESIWTVRHQRTKHIYHDHVIDTIVVVGNDPLYISKNPIFVKRLYQKVFGKDRWKTEYDKGTIKVFKVELGKSLGESQAADNDPVLYYELDKKENKTKEIELIFK